MGHPSSLFDDLDVKFRYLITGPRPLALHGRVLGHGAPKRPIPLQELRALLAEYENWPLHDAVMRELIRRANAPTGGEAWMVAITWTLLPALRDCCNLLPAQPTCIQPTRFPGADVPTSTHKDSRMTDPITTNSYVKAVWMRTSMY